MTTYRDRLDAGEHEAKPEKRTTDRFGRKIASSSKASKASTSSSKSKSKSG